MDISARAKRLMERYDIDVQDVVYCDLVNSGWGIAEAAYYAYSLTYPDKRRLNQFIDDRRKMRPGINKYIFDFEQDQKDAKRELKELKQRLSNRQTKEAKEAEEKQEVTEQALRTKQGMLDYLIQLAATPNLDPKMKADLAKQITDLQQYKKEEIKEEDTHIHFHLPINCKYCDRCVNCSLKLKLDSLGFNITKACQNPLIWKIADDK